MVSGTSIGNHQHQYVYIIISNAILSIWLICIQYIKTIRYTYSYLINMSKKDDISDFSVSCLFQNRLKHIYIYIYIPFLPQMPLVPNLCFRFMTWTAMSHQGRGHTTPIPHPSSTDEVRWILQNQWGCCGWIHITYSTCTANDWKLKFILL